jgi:hypothetical protein
MLQHSQAQILVAYLSTRDAVVDRYQRVVGRDERGAVTVEQVIITAALTLLALGVTYAITAVVNARIGSIKV